MAKLPQKKPDPTKPPSIQVLPMNLRLGDVLADEIAEWRVVGRPYSTGGGKVVNIRVESVKQPGVTQALRGALLHRSRPARVSNRNNESSTQVPELVEA